MPWVKPSRNLGTDQTMMGQVSLGCCAEGKGTQSSKEQGDAACKKREVFLGLRASSSLHKEQSPSEMSPSSISASNVALLALQSSLSHLRGVGLGMDTLLRG